MIDVYIGKIGSGKKTLLNHQLRLALGFSKLLEYSTMSEHTKTIENETFDMKDYKIISRESFNNMKESGNFMTTDLRHVKVNGKTETCYFGIPVVDAEKNYAVISSAENLFKYIELYKDYVHVFYIKTDDDIILERIEKNKNINKDKFYKIFEKDKQIYTDEFFEKVKQALGRSVVVLNNNEERILKGGFYG